ncbi:hypothetical protein IJG66_00365 [Candidatus Saccharibacteria bacterium]|nr:hypothetical protein [Candidatus Saccharibacteria bacterium]
MNNFPEVGIIILAAIVHATLQLGSGCLLLLYHASLGKHIRKRTKSLVSSYIAGSGLMVLLGISLFYLAIAGIYGQTLSVGCLTVAAGAMVVLAILMWFVYYRRGKTTELWLPKVVAKFITKRAEVTESNTEAFSLGMLSGFAEVPFTFVLMAVAANSLLSLQLGWQVVLAVIYVVIAVLPLVLMRLMIRRGKTVVDVQKWRVKNKTFLRIISGATFAVLAMFIIAFKVMK